ncbi:NADPH-dependent FMN reductase [Nonomuraea jabiensis]|uniref:NAD(P)H-dependent FMN reductase n=1 Tax=Nonomuraea jabiensis TaxID=882448 RepID=A0A7W9LGU6_9ACTN|nr:NAD(P)H-dependent oxidoreductase [Nonomuraea jabiensis]MBB5783208.1 NAD(P)H-dependent FMN reductase [Nonomuraea jabiensis]
MSGAPLKLAVIIGSTREGRFGSIVGSWLVDRVRDHGGFELDVIDLAEVSLPIVQQKHPVSTGEYPEREVRDFAARIGAADAFVVVTPEYNHGYPASLKLAIDSVHPEWWAKPVAFVSYGGYAGGLRAVEQLRLVFAELHATTIRETVSFHMAYTQFDETGRPHDAESVNAAAKLLLDQLGWWGEALRAARAARPYVC